MDAQSEHTTRTGRTGCWSITCLMIPIQLPLPDGAPRAFALPVTDGTCSPEAFAAAFPTDEAAIRRARSPTTRAQRRVSTLLKRWMVGLATPLTKGPWGKPQCAHAEFNVAHDGAWVVGAVHPSMPVGIDVVHLARDVAPEALRPSFTDDEWADITAAPTPLHRLLQRWAHKEAVLKCLGVGLTWAPKRVRVVEGTVWVDDAPRSDLVLWTGALDPEYWVCLVYLTDAASS